MLMTNLDADNNTLGRSGWGGELRVNPARVLQTLVNNLDGMIFRCALDEELTMLFVSSGCKALTGYEPDALVQNRDVSYNAITHPEDREPVRQAIMEAVKNQRRYRIEYRIIRADGSVCWVAERGAQVVDETGCLVMEGFVEDISEQIQAQMDLAAAEARYRSIFENSSEGIFQTTEDGHYLSANPALANIYGYATPEELIAALQNIGSQLYVDPSSRECFQRIMRERGSVHGFEAQVRRHDGTVIWISENARAVRAPDGSFLYYEGTVQDITETKRYQEQLEHQASHDLLTGLPNRNLFTDRLKQAIRQADRNGYFAAVAFIDLDNFKYINDSLGHKAGDELLVEIAARLHSCLRGGDTVARYGGDEFVLLLGNHYQVNSVVKVINRVLEEIQRPLVVGGQELCVTCSIGLSLYPSDGGDPQSLIQHADAAMYLAKESGRNNYQFFTRRLNEMAMERVTLEGSLRRALEREELKVFYQVKVDSEGRPVGVEALLRWYSNEHGLVSPDRFIGLAEDTGLIEPITEFVLRSACRQAVQWQKMGYPAMQMAVNLSARSLKQDNLVDNVMAILDETGLPPSQLELELTESTLIVDVDESIRVLNAIKSRGIRLAIDDFGTGYSSLSYLQRFPVDILKIDRAFVHNLEVHPSDTDITKLIVLLGHSLKLKVVAEGVETENQFDHLVSLGCDEFQGYYFSRPMGPQELEAHYLGRYRAS